MSYKVSMLSLGCEKNRVDAEILLSNLKNAGYEIVPDVFLCDIAIVNTCGFIDDAKRESIDEILNLIRLKENGIIKFIVVTGCLAQRYQEEVVSEFPEVDAVIGIGDNGNISKAVESIINGVKYKSFPDKLSLPLNGDRIRTTPSYYAYLKIAEGCDNRCAYCAIPLIRGRFRSRRMEDILKEAWNLAKSGVKELLVIAQDTTRYGEDIYQKLILPDLLNELCKIDGIEWIRILYCYPDRVTDELLDVILKQDKILNYIDIPLQHCSGKILKSMNRRGDKNSLLKLIEKIRAKIPDVTLRTTFICGFPGEDDEDFTELCEFCNEVKFDRLGCFTYSKEEDTPAFYMDNQVTEDLKIRRQEIIMQQQALIMEEKNKKKIGKVFKVLVEEYKEDEDTFYARSKEDSPDVDGRVLFKSENKNIRPGEFVNVKITGYLEYDLIGTAID